MKSVTESGFPFLMERQFQPSPTINSYIIPSNAFGRPIRAPVTGLPQDSPISSVPLSVRDGSRKRKANIEQIWSAVFRLADTDCVHEDFAEGPEQKGASARTQRRSGHAAS